MSKASAGAVELQVCVTIYVRLICLCIAQADSHQLCHAADLLYQEFNAFFGSIESEWMAGVVPVFSVTQKHFLFPFPNFCLD